MSDNNKAFGPAPISASDLRMRMAEKELANAKKAMANDPTLRVDDPAGLGGKFFVVLDELDMGVGQFLEVGRDVFGHGAARRQPTALILVGQTSKQAPHLIHSSWAE